MTEFMAQICIGKYFMAEINMAKICMVIWAKFFMAKLFTTNFFMAKFRHHCTLKYFCFKILQYSKQKYYSTTQNKLNPLC